MFKFPESAQHLGEYRGGERMWKNMHSYSALLALSPLWIYPKLKLGKK
jgi:hypothetical protein